MARKQKAQDGPITIKKYANRRLYNTATSSYVTLDDLCGMVKEGQEFVVYDAKSGEDITRAVLTQIIVEEEAKGQNLLPIGFLRQLISFYGDSLQGLVPRYLEYSMKSFAKNQEQMRLYLQNAFDGLFPFGAIDDMGKQNMDMMERAMQMIVPLGPGGEAGGPGEGKGEAKGEAADEAAAAPAEAAPTETAEAKSLAELKRKIDALEEQLEKLSARKDG